MKFLYKYKKDINEDYQHSYRQVKINTFSAKKTIL